VELDHLIQYCNESATISRLRDNQFLEVNEAFVETTGYRPEEVIGRTALELGLWESAELYLETRRRLVATGAVRGLRTTLRTKSGEIRQCIFSAVLRDVNGEPCCISFVSDITERIQQDERLRATEHRLRYIISHAPVFANDSDPDGIMPVLPGYPDRMAIQERDITAQEVYEAELKLARDGALASARLQSAFVANISHEVRTPLNVILGYLDVIADHLNELGDTSQNEYIQSAARAGQRLTETISNVLDYSKVEAGLFQPHRQPMRLAEFIAPRVEQFRSACEQKRIELRFIDETDDTVILADEYCVSVAVRNLLDNAVKFTERGAITVRQFPAGCEICLEIKDTGVGMEAKFLAKLFEPFIQEDTGFTRNFEGSGLGLALTKRLLEACDGRIAVHSEKGVGSVFTVYLPAAATVNGDRRRPGKPFKRARLPVLLVVEDDASTQKMMRVLLHDTYIVRVAAGLAEVKRELLVTDPPITAVLMDISLRGAESGLDITRFLRATDTYRTLPIVALTAHTSPEHHRMALEAGCDAVLTKPVVRDQILEALAKASNGKHSFSVI
jgi:PAS domain S-box-containing protein